VVIPSKRLAGPDTPEKLTVSPGLPEWANVTELNGLGPNDI
jgi:hypothetical protein